MNEEIKFTDTSDKRVISGPISLSNLAERIRRLKIAEVTASDLEEKAVENRRAVSRQLDEARSEYLKARKEFEKDLGLHC